MAFVFDPTASTQNEQQRLPWTLAGNYGVTSVIRRSKPLASLAIILMIIPTERILT